MSRLIEKCRALVQWILGIDEAERRWQEAADEWETVARFYRARFELAYDHCNQEVVDPWLDTLCEIQGLPEFRHVPTDMIL